MAGPAAAARLSPAPRARTPLALFAVLLKTAPRARPPTRSGRRQPRAQTPPQPRRGGGARPRRVAAGRRGGAAPVAAPGPRGWCEGALEWEAVPASGAGGCVRGPRPVRASPGSRKLRLGAAGSESFGGLSLDCEGILRARPGRSEGEEDEGGSRSPSPFPRYNGIGPLRTSDCKAASRSTMWYLIQLRKSPAVLGPRQVLSPSPEPGQLKKAKVFLYCLSILVLI
ncbi:uncharacterized protein [Patagioenas fasciata]|uniref:uncharacterized protein n=1 Tax=Patagioenas fasciata TaxID=372321 RepID=UPI003A99D2BE